MFLSTDGKTASVSGIEDYRDGQVLAWNNQAIAVKFPGQKYWWGRALGSHESNWKWVSPQTVIFQIKRQTEKGNYEVEILLGWEHSRRKPDPPVS